MTLSCWLCGLSRSLLTPGPPCPGDGGVSCRVQTMYVNAVRGGDTGPSWDLLSISL